MILLTEELLRKQANDAIVAALQVAGWAADTVPEYGPHRFLTEQVILDPKHESVLYALQIRRYMEWGDLYAFAKYGEDWEPCVLNRVAPFQFTVTLPETEGPPELVWIYRWTPRTVPTPLKGETLTSAVLNDALARSSMVLEEIGDELQSRPGPCGQT